MKTIFGCFARAVRSVTAISSLNVFFTTVAQVKILCQFSLSGVCKDVISLTHAVLYTVPLYCYCLFLSPQYRQGVQGGVPGACNSWHRGRGHRLLPRLGDVWALSPCGRASLGGGSRPQWHWAICSVPGEAQTVHLFRAFHFLRTFEFGPGLISRHSRIILIVSSGGNMEFFKTCWCSYETQQAALLMSPGLDSVSNCCSVLIHYPLQIFASFPLSTYSISFYLLYVTLSYPSFCLVHDSPSFLLTEYLQCWVLYSFIQGKEVSVLHLKILWMKIFLFPFFNFTIQGWLQGCTVMLHFLSWHFIVFLFEVKLWFFFLSYFFCWPDCIPACLGSVLSVMHAALSCREMMMANFNWHIPHLQQFAPLDVVQISSREVWNALRWEDRVHQLASPVNHWSSHHNAVFHWETLRVSPLDLQYIFYLETRHSSLWQWHSPITTVTAVVQVFVCGYNDLVTHTQLVSVDIT